MTKRVLDVGNCTPDHSAISTLLDSKFQVDIVQAHGEEDAWRHLQSDRFDLVLVNRIYDRDGGSGLELIERMKSASQLANQPVMLITNYPEHQQAAISLGALPGFGKAELDAPQTSQKLSALLDG